MCLQVSELMISWTFLEASIFQNLYAWKPHSAILILGRLQPRGLQPRLSDYWFEESIWKHRKEHG